ncbi:MAG TPA: hypothetical protein VNM90_29375, partial [Haliangium sp.]|nr:hypothetical protein [Haliangium sp.]
MKARQAHRVRAAHSTRPERPAASRPRARAIGGTAVAACARLALLGALCVASGPACRRSSPAVAAQGDDSLAAMRLRVAADPEDVDARVALARLERAAGRPGAAF